MPDLPFSLPDPATHGFLYLGVAVLAVALFAASRVRWLRRLLGVASWAALLLALVAVLGQRAAFDPWLGRIAAALKLEKQSVVGAETRIRMSADGHFWVRATIDGVARRLLVDSGATVTALSPATARAAGLTLRSGPVPVILQTANGSITAQTATVGELRLGNIVARDLAAVVSPGLGDMDVVGMNFLSRLKGWRVEEGELILTPHHPQAGGD